MSTICILHPFKINFRICKSFWHSKFNSHNLPYGEQVRQFFLVSFLTASLTLLAAACEAS